MMANKTEYAPCWRFMRRGVVALLVAVVAFMPAFPQEKNGFDLSNAIIDTDKIFHGGPPRDGIPAINAPKFVAAEAVDYLRDDDIVIGVSIGETRRAYPARILVWHEVVNDVINGQAVAVTYCPLCGTNIVFNGVVGGKRRTFGVSGLLYQSDVLLYDRESESLWSQLQMQAISGEEVGVKLSWLPSEHITWTAWREKYPDGEVLSVDTGYSRRYDGEAYAAYFASDEIMFPVPQTRHELANKAWVVGVLINGEAKAYPLAALPDKKEIADMVGGQPINLHYTANSRHPKITAANGEVVPSVVSFWFAWQAFYPNTQLWTPDT